jgi:hypothetical protein
MDLVVEIYRATARFPKHEVYGLSQQYGVQPCPQALKRGYCQRLIGTSELVPFPIPLTTAFFRSPLAVGE